MSAIQALKSLLFQSPKPLTLLRCSGYTKAKMGTLKIAAENLALPTGNWRADLFLNFVEKIIKRIPEHMQFLYFFIKKFSQLIYIFFSLCRNEYRHVMLIN